MSLDGSDEIKLKLERHFFCVSGFSWLSRPKVKQTRSNALVICNGTFQANILSCFSCSLCVSKLDKSCCGMWRLSQLTYSSSPLCEISKVTFFFFFKKTYYSRQSFIRNSACHSKSTNQDREFIRPIRQPFIELCWFKACYQRQWLTLKIGLPCHAHRAFPTFFSSSPVFSLLRVLIHPHEPGAHCLTYRYAILWSTYIHT